DEGLPANSATAPIINLRLDAPIYIAFSRESQKPLPVEISQRSLIHLLKWQQNTFGLQATDRFAFLAPINSDTVVRDILLPLLIGASLYVPSRSMHKVNLGHWLARKRITVCNLTGTQAGQLSTYLAGDAVQPVLRTIFFAEERLQESQVRALRQQFARAELVALYGSAESALVAGYHVIPAAGLLLENDVIPLGQGVTGFDLLVLNEHGQLAGIGELGEIFVRSPYLAQGYLNRPKLTATHFVMSRRFGRMWRTRDFGRIRPDGLIELVGE
ncbi:MAG TPA: hypothetical protein ENJ56_02955, partial [Anaerolineae bacterium]|nr:hypothetical protein [Anaerolineae bacterium]